MGNKIETFLSIDVGTENLKIALCYEEQGRAYIIGFQKIPQTRGSIRAAIITNINSIIEKIDMAVGLIVTEVKKSFDINLPKKAVFGIAGELVLGSTVHIEIERKNNKSVTSSEYQAILDNARGQVFESVKSVLAESACLPLESLIEVNTDLIGVKADGQNAVEIVGVNAEVLELIFFIAYAPNIYIDTLNKIANHFSIENYKICVEPYAISRTIELDDNLTNNCVIVDIGGGTTDVAVVSKKELLGTKMYGIGGSTFTKYIADKMGISFEDAEDLKLQYSNQKLSHSEEIEVSRIIDKAAFVWAKSMEVALMSLVEDREVPYNFFFCGGSSLLPNIQEIMLSYPWQQKLNFVKFPKYNFLFPNKIKDVYDKTRLANSLSDVAVIALASYYIGSK
jgi:cell division protein FtsA